MPNSLKILLLRRKGYVGRGVHVGFGSWIDAEKVQLADNVRIGKFTQIKVRTLVMARDSEITNWVTVGGMDGPDSYLRLGVGSVIMERCYVNPTFGVSIGANVGVGGHTLIFTHGSWGNVLKGYPYQAGGVWILDDVWVPWRCTILPNVKIGQGSVIGACSLVNKSIPDHCLAVGIPAKVIQTNYPKPLTKAEKEEWNRRICEEASAYLNWKRINATSKNIADFKSRYGIRE